MMMMVMMGEGEESAVQQLGNYMYMYVTLCPQLG